MGKSKGKNHDQVSGAAELLGLKPTHSSPASKNGDYEVLLDRAAGLYYNAHLARKVKPLSSSDWCYQGCPSYSGRGIRYFYGVLLDSTSKSANFLHLQQT